MRGIWSLFCEAATGGGSAPEARAKRVRPGVRLLCADPRSLWHFAQPLALRAAVRDSPLVEQMQTRGENVDWIETRESGVPRTTLVRFDLISAQTLKDQGPRKSTGPKRGGGELSRMGRRRAAEPKSEGASLHHARKEKGSRLSCVGRPGNSSVAYLVKPFFEPPGLKKRHLKYFEWPEFLRIALRPISFNGRK